MAAPGKQRATYQDVLDAPEHKVAEIINGELHLSPRPAMRATSVAFSLALELGSPFRRGRGGPGGWILLAEPELHLGDEVLVPDLAGWRRERLTEIPDTAAISVVPDWVCEVLSPSNERLDRAEKLPLYASLGVASAWLVNPRVQLLEAYRLHDGKWLQIAVHRDGERASLEPFDAIELDVGALWLDLPPPTRAAEAAADWSF